MYPTNALRDEVGAALAADAGSLGAVLALHVHLMLAPLVPGAQTDFTAGTPATFTGSAAKVAGASPQLDGIDSATDELVLTIKEPAGGWRWECTVAPDPTQTCVAYCVTDNADLITWGSGLLAAPVTISAVGHFIEIGSITLRIPNPFAT